MGIEDFADADDLMLGFETDKAIEVFNQLFILSVADFDNFARRMKDMDKLEVAAMLAIAMERLEALAREMKRRGTE